MLAYMTDPVYSPTSSIGPYVAPLKINELLQPLESLTWMAKMNLKLGLFKKDKSPFVLIELIFCIISKCIMLQSLIRAVINQK